MKKKNKTRKREGCGEKGVAQEAETKHFPTDLNEKEIKLVSREVKTKTIQETETKKLQSWKQKTVSR